MLHQCVCAHISPLSALHTHCVCRSVVYCITAWRNCLLISRQHHFTLIHISHNGDMRFSLFSLSSTAQHKKSCALLGNRKVGLVCALHKIHGVPSRVYTVKKKLLETHLYILFQCLPCVWFINRGGLPKGCALLFIIPTPLAAQGFLSRSLRLCTHPIHPPVCVFALFWPSPHALSSLFWFIIVIRVAIEVSLICICFAVTDLLRGCLFLRFGPLCASARVFKHPSITFGRCILLLNQI